MSADTKKAAVLLVAIGGGLLLAFTLVTASPMTLGPPYIEACAILAAIALAGVVARPIARAVFGYELASDRTFFAGAAAVLPLAACFVMSALVVNGARWTDAQDVTCRVLGQRYAKGERVVGYDVLCFLPDGEKARNGMPRLPGDAPLAARIPVTVARGTLGVWLVVARRPAVGAQP